MIEFQTVYHRPHQVCPVRMTIRCELITIKYMQHDAKHKWSEISRKKKKKFCSKMDKWTAVKDSGK